MPVQLNHTIVSGLTRLPRRRSSPRSSACRRRAPFGPFVVVEVYNGVSLDFLEGEGATPQHYAFLVGEAEFDEIFGRIRDAGPALLGRSRPAPAGEINTNDGGRGVYWEDPERPRPGDHHPPVRQRRLSPTAGQTLRRRSLSGAHPSRTRAGTAD